MAASTNSVRDIAVFHPGTQHSWQTATALDELGRLAWYATSIFHQPDRFPYFLERLPGPLGQRIGARLRRFRHPALDPQRVRTLGILEWVERIAGFAGFDTISRALDAWGNARFGRALAPALSDPAIRSVWGYNASSLTLFEAPQTQDKLRILDRTTGDWRAYNAAMDDVAVRYPDWFLPLERRVPDSLIAHDDREYAAADVILCGSEFAAQTVRDHAGAAARSKLRVLPYCFDAALFDALPPPRPVARDEPIRFLFLGLAIPRKGIQYALEAIMQFPPEAARLTVVGQLGIPAEVFARYVDRVDYRPSVARAEVPRILAEHHVLVFPTHFEGAGLVLFEALAAGCALIQSDRAALAVTPETGLLLPEPSTPALVAAMALAVEDRDALDAWRAAAQGEARRYSFANYRAGIAALLGELGLSTAATTSSSASILASHDIPSR